MDQTHRYPKVFRSRLGQEIIRFVLIVMFIRTAAVMGPHQPDPQAVPKAYLFAIGVVSATAAAVWLVIEVPRILMEWLRPADAGKVDADVDIVWQAEDADDRGWRGEV